MGEKDKGTNYKTMLEKLLLDFGILKKGEKITFISQKKDLEGEYDEFILSKLCLKCQQDTLSNNI